MKPGFNKLNTNAQIRVAMTRNGAFLLGFFVLTAFEFKCQVKFDHHIYVLIPYLLYLIWRSVFLHETQRNQTKCSLTQI